MPALPTTDKLYAGPNAVDAAYLGTTLVWASGPFLVLTGRTAAENASVGTTVGTLSVANPGAGTPTYTLTDSAGGKFSLTGATLKVASALDYETATFHSVTVHVTGMSPNPSDRSFIVLVTDVDDTAPIITSATTASNVENSVLAFALTANESVTWSIVGGADQARFEISGSTLRWLSNGTKDFEAPNDADTDNAYIVQVRATDLASNQTNQTITVTVTDVLDAAAGVANQTLEFGQLTAQTTGGIAPTATGGSITAAAITSGTNANHWSITSAGVITPSATGDSADLAASPYSLLCTFTVGGTAGLTATITINTVANAYSIANNSELNTLIGASVATTSGKSALCRSGTYTMVTISTDWTSDFTITKHTGASPIFQGFLLNSVTHLVIDRLEIYNDISSGNLIEMYNGSTLITVSNCALHAKYYDPLFAWGTLSPMPQQVEAISCGSSSPGTVTIVDNNFYDVYRGIKMAASGTVTISRNVFRTIVSDGIVVLGPYEAVPQPTVIIEDNDISDIWSTYDNEPTGSDHCDGIQLLANAGTGDMLVSIKRNCVVQTAPFAGIVTQGIFADLDAIWMTGTIEGNLVVTSAPNGLVIESAKNLTVRGNTVVRHNHGGSGLNYSTGIAIGNEDTSGTHIISDNVSEFFDIGGTPTLTNNVTMGADGALHSYAACFVGTTFIPSTVADALTKFAMKVGGDLDLTTDVGAIPTYLPRGNIIETIVAGALPIVGATITPIAPASETTVFSTTLTGNDTAVGGYSFRSMFPVTGMSDAAFLVLVADYGATSDARTKAGLGSITGPGAGADTAFQTTFDSYPLSHELLGGTISGTIYNVNSVKIRGSGTAREICARLEASSAAATNIDNVSIGIWDGTTSAASPHNGSTKFTPVELKWGGASGISMSTGTMSAYSDWMPFPDNVNGVYGAYILQSANSGWAGYTFVTVLNAANLRAASGATQARIVIGLGGPPAVGMATDVYIGQQAASGDAYDFAATPARFLWGGSGTITHNGTQQLYISDWVTLPQAWDNTKNYCVAFQFVGSGALDVRYNSVTTTSGTNHYKNGVAEAATINKTGYSAIFASNDCLIEILEVR